MEGSTVELKANEINYYLTRNGFHKPYVRDPSGSGLVTFFKASGKSRKAGGPEYFCCIRKGCSVRLILENDGTGKMKGHHNHERKRKRVIRVIRENRTAIVQNLHATDGKKEDNVKPDKPLPNDNKTVQPQS